MRTVSNQKLDVLFAKLHGLKRMRKYYVWCRNLLSLILQYRLNFFLSFAAVIVPLIIQISLWKAIFGFTGIQSIKGYTLGSLIVYYLLANWIATALEPSLKMETVSDISTGGLNHYLIKPINYLLCRSLDTLVANLVFGLAGMIIVVPIAVFLLKEYFVAVPLFAGYNMLYGFLFLILAFILSSEICTILSLVSFFIEQATFVSRIQYLVMPFLTGQLLPIELFPDKLRAVVSVLPFQYLVLKPVQAFMGKVDPATIPKDIFIATLWIIGFGSLVYLMWRRGLRRYEAYGG